ncbi:MAG TPA: menaquinone biosynthesis protein [Candidatus Acidoferrum sp.]|nr:menaquinone biosynthesis protein [Candidatus Acidoferrum sp.]
MRRLRYGRISYVNVGPVETAFDAGAVTRDVEVVPAVPSQLNHAMSAGEIDAGAISAAHYLENREHFARIADLCIASDGPVRSVLFVSPKPPALVGSSTIALTSHSASGRALLATLLRSFPDGRPRFEVVDDALAAARAGVPTLLIGDDALVARSEMPQAQVHDLGEIWRAWTGLPFVFGVWAVRREALAAYPSEVAALTEALVAARDWGERNRSAVIDAAIAVKPYHRALYADYFTRLLYRLDERAEQGLERFSTLFRPEVFGVAS